MFAEFGWPFRLREGNHRHYYSVVEGQTRRLRLVEQGYWYYKDEMAMQSPQVIPIRMEKIESLVWG